MCIHSIVLGMYGYIMCWYKQGQVLTQHFIFSACVVCGYTCTAAFRSFTRHTCVPLSVTCFPYQAEEKKLQDAEKSLEESASLFDEFLKENDKNSVEAIKMCVLWY